MDASRLVSVISCLRETLVAFIVSPTVPMLSVYTSVVVAYCTVAVVGSLVSKPIKASVLLPLNTTGRRTKRGACVSSSVFVVKLAVGLILSFPLASADLIWKKYCTPANKLPSEILWSRVASSTTVESVNDSASVP